MVLLLDENLPRKLKYRFSDQYEILTLNDLGWNGKTNGDLLSLMQEKDLKILLSVDKNMSHQQNLEKYEVSLVVLNSRDTRYPALAKFVPVIEDRLKEKLRPGLIEINLPES